MNIITKLIGNNHLNQFKKGDKVKVISCPRNDGADAYSGIVGIIEDIELRDRFRTGIGSIIINLENGGSFIATGILNRLTLSKINIV